MNTNYCAELIDSLTHKHHVNSTVYCDEINQAIKFRLPDNGRKRWSHMFEQLKAYL